MYEYICTVQYLQYLCTVYATLPNATTIIYELTNASSACVMHIHTFVAGNGAVNGKRTEETAM